MICNVDNGSGPKSVPLVDQIAGQITEGFRLH
jgi:hypothetical protein